MTMPGRNDSPKNASRAAGVPDYLKEAFLFRWNLLFFLGSTAAAALTPVSGILLPLVAAGELTYLAGLVSIPRFRAAIDAKVHATTSQTGTGPPPAQPPLSRPTDQNASSVMLFEFAHDASDVAFARVNVSPPESFTPIIGVIPILALV